MTPLCVDYETRQQALTPKERALSRDSFVRAFDEQWANWTSIAKCCIDVERDRDYEILGYRSFGEWLVNAAPRCRSYLYLVIGRYKELIPDISEEDLAQIPLGSAGVLRQLSSSKRRESKIRQSARQKPEKFIADLQQMEPFQHLEPRIEKTLKFTVSQWTVIDQAWQAYKVLDGNASLECFFEFCVSEKAD